MRAGLSLKPIAEDTGEQRAAEELLLARHAAASAHTQLLRDPCG